ncbi:MAG: hypothetical protein ABIH03_06835 [Pseudomonadota bacterium]
MNTANPNALLQRASANLEKWGKQDFEMLGLAICEEAGELAQAILQTRHEGGFEDCIFDEAIGLGALCLQVMEHWNGDHKPITKGGKSE